MKRIFIFILLFAPVLLLKSQEQKSLFPNGWHIGLRGEANLTQRVSVIPTESNSSTVLHLPPKSYPMIGGKGGVEISYHFADYFGVALGIDFGTIGQVGMMLRTEANYYGPKVSERFYGFQIPIKMEFHFPIKNNFFFMGAVGINLMDVGKSVLNSFGRDDQMLSRGTVFHGFGCELELSKEVMKVDVDMQLHLGFYYRLPYNDLLRCSLVGNLAFKDKFQGYYNYINDNY